MSAANFVMVSATPETKPEDLILFLCKECDEEMPAMDSDSHAVRRHKASSIRVFNSEWGYASWVMEQDALRKIRETKERT